jgi:Holliday junction resolvase
MSSASRGAAAEREARDVLREAGYFVVKVAASKGPADLVAIRPGGVVLFVQVKCGAGRLRPPEWNELLSAARRYGAVPVLAERETRKPLRWYKLAGPKAEGGRGAQPLDAFDPGSYRVPAGEWAEVGYIEDGRMGTVRYGPGRVFALSDPPDTLVDT